MTILVSCIAAINLSCTEARSLSGYMYESSSIPEDEQASEEPNIARTLYIRRVFGGRGLVRRGYYRPGFGYRPGVGLATGLVVGSLAGAAIANNRNNYYNNYGYYGRNLEEASPVSSKTTVRDKTDDKLSDGAADSNGAADAKDKFATYVTDTKEKLSEMVTNKQGELAGHITKARDKFSANLSNAKDKLSKGYLPDKLAEKIKDYLPGIFVINQDKEQDNSVDSSGTVNPAKKTLKSFADFLD